MQAQKAKADPSPDEIQSPKAEGSLGADYMGLFYGSEAEPQAFFLWSVLLIQWKILPSGDYLASEGIRGLRPVKDVPELSEEKKYI